MTVIALVPNLLNTSRASCVVCIILGFFNAGITLGQTDTLFWFVAPEISALHGDRPILFRFATLAESAEIVVSQPANPNFPVLTVTLGPYESQSMDLTNYIDIIENKPSNTVLNYGFKISATAPVTAYYEVNPYCACNPDIFTLKGNNGLGESFVLPFQTYLNNPSYGKSAFNIVATQDNTTININPTQNLIGHAANTTFSITLNAGQTWCGESSGFAGSQHPTGSTVSSDKPIAITISDDSMQGTPYGGCADMMGDQLVPIEITGNQYIAVKGYLNGPDKVYIVAITDGTTIEIDGIPAGALNASQAFELTLYNPATYIETSSNVYVLHTTGFGCEVGGALLPSIECTGSNSVAFVRSTQEFFALNILVPAGGETGFVLNGDPLAINPAAFSEVPGTNGDWLFAQINASAIVPANIGSRLSNNLQRFHLGVVHGGAWSGCRYGYFTDYSTFRYQIQATADVVCEGQPLEIYAENVPGGLYNWSGPNNFTFDGQTVYFDAVQQSMQGEYIVSGYEGACEVIPDTLQVTINPINNSTDSAHICSGQSLNFAGMVLDEPGTYFGNLTSVNGCDSIVALDLFVHPVYDLDVTAEICDGYSYNFGGNTYTQPGEYTVTYTSSMGCDSVYTLTINLITEYYTETEATICDGQFLEFNGQQLSEQGGYSAVLQSTAGCDSLVTLELTVHPSFDITFPIEICEGESYLLGGNNYAQSGIYPIMYSTNQGCDSLVTLQLTVHPVYTSNISQSICEGESYFFNGESLSDPGTYSVVLAGNAGCDSIAELQLAVNPIFESHFDTTICSGNSFAYNGLIYYESGVYPVMLSSSQGCDSLMVLHLNVSDAEVPALNWSTTPEATGFSAEFIVENSAAFEEVLFEIDGNLSVYSGPVVFQSEMAYGILEFCAFGVNEHNCASQYCDLIRTESLPIVYIPNTVTPNNDGHNDFFEVVTMGLQPLENSELRIFNRWGELIYMSLFPDFRWEGGVSDGDYYVPDGVYIYQVSLNYPLAANNRIITGHITVLR